MIGTLLMYFGQVMMGVAASTALSNTSWVLLFTYMGIGVLDIPESGTNINVHFVRDIVMSAYLTCLIMEGGLVRSNKSLLVFAIIIALIVSFWTILDSAKKGELRRLWLVCYFGVGGFIGGVIYMHLHHVGLA